MATAAKYAEWLQANPDKKGSDLYQRATDAYKAARMQELGSSHPGTAGQMTIGQYMAKNKALPNEYGEEANVTEQVGRGMMDVYQGSKQLGMNAAELAGGADSSDYNARLAEELRLYNENNPDIQIGRIAGNIATPLSIIPGAGGTSLAARGATTLGAGAMYGAAQPVQDSDFWSTKGEQAAVGAALGAVLPAGVKLAYAGRHLLRPFSDTGITKDLGELFLKEAGGPESIQKIRDAILSRKTYVSGNNPTVGNAIADAVRGSGDDFGAGLVRLEKDLATEGPQGEALRAQAARQAQARKSVIDSIAGSDADLENAIAAREVNAARNYGAVRNDRISPKSNVQILNDAAVKAEQLALRKEISKAKAMQDWGRLKTLEAQSAHIAKGNPPVAGTIRDQSTLGVLRDGSQRFDRALPEVPNEWVSPRYKGEVRAPSRYAPQTPLAQEAANAADEFKSIAAHRLTQQNALNDINRTMLLNLVGESNTGLHKFLSRPSVIKAIQDARDSSLETGGYFPTKSGESFTVGNLQRIKRSIADSIRMRAKEGSLGATEQREVTDTLNQFSDWLKSKSPGFAKAEGQFASDSIPIDRMAVGRELQKGLSKSSDLSSPIESPVPFLSSVREGPRTMKRATGFNRYNDISDILRPEQVSGVKNVAEELLRKQQQDKMASSVKPIFGKLETGIEPRLPRMLERSVVLANYVLKRLGMDKSPDYQRVAIDILQNPDKLLPLLQLPADHPKRRLATEIMNQMARQIPSQTGAQVIGE